MHKIVMIRVVEEYNPFELIDDIRSIGFHFDHLIPYTKDGMLLVGEMHVSDIMLLKCFEGVSSFKVGPTVDYI